jgi:Zn-dependent metalloprotease
MRLLRGILPPHMLRHIIEYGNAEERARALQTLAISEIFRGRRAATPPQSAASLREERRVYDGHRGTTLPGQMRRHEGAVASGDAAVDEVYDALGAAYDLFHEAFGRDSVDDQGLPLTATVHYGEDYDNAFWNGQQIVCGDGDGRLFNRFTVAPDVIGHELAHGVTQYEAHLRYRDQPGALNESFSDVLGILVKQRLQHTDVAHASWLIGEGLFTRQVHGVALRSMSAPGTAYDDPVLGRDPQPASMRDYVRTDEDQGGVHINSGIPNRAFYLAASALGGFAWERAGRIWYVALRDKLRETSTFGRAAALTIETAVDLFGEGGAEQQAVAAAWHEVGVDVRAAMAV